MDYVEKRQGRKLVLFGAGGNAAQLIYNHFILDTIEFICDNDEKKHNKKMMGIPICSPKKLLDTPENFVVIVTLTSPLLFQQVSEMLSLMGIPYVYNYHILSLISKTETYDSPWCNSFREFNPYQEICKNYDKTQLVRSMLSDEKSLKVYDSFILKMKYSLSDYTDICDFGNTSEYFFDDVFSYTDEEIFIDGGSYDGTDTICYFKKLGSKYKKAYCFEPDDNNYSRVCDAITTAFDVPVTYTDGNAICDGGIFKIFKAGLSNQNNSMNFLSLGTEGSRYTGKSGKTPIVKLDDIVDKTDVVTLIKLDIEGHELYALNGMAKIIQENKPKLAICIYHKLADLWEIPLYIKKLVPEYKFFVRHHGSGVFGKILYATI